MENIMMIEFWLFHKIRVNSGKRNPKKVVEENEESFPKLFETRTDRCKKFNANQDNFGSQKLNVKPFKSLRLKLSNQQLRIAIGLCLGSKVCEKHKTACGKHVTEDEWHGLSCLKSAERFCKYSKLNVL